MLPLQTSVSFSMIYFEFNFFVFIFSFDTSTIDSIHMSSRARNVIKTAVVVDGDEKFSKLFHELFS